MLTCDICVKVNNKCESYGYGKLKHAIGTCFITPEHDIKHVCPKCADKLDRAIKKLIHVPDL